MTHELEINGKQYLLLPTPYCRWRDIDGAVFVGAISNLTEEECEPLVEKIFVEETPHASNDMAGGFHYEFIDYERRGDFAGWHGDAGCYRKAKASFISLIKSKGILAKSFVHKPDANDACYKSADGFVDVDTWAADYAKYNALPEELILIEKK